MDNAGPDPAYRAELRTMPAFEPGTVAG
jgi:hypothetical protein